MNHHEATTRKFNLLQFTYPSAAENVLPDQSDKSSSILTSNYCELVTECSINL